MDWSFPPEAEEFRNEVKEFIAEHLTEDVLVPRTMEQSITGNSIKRSQNADG